MTDQFDDTDNGGQQNNGGGLRKQLEDALGRLKTLETENGSLKTQARQASISGVLTEKKYPAKVAKLIPETVPPTPEGVQAWLDEYGDVFNITKDESAGGAEVEGSASGTAPGAVGDDEAMEYIQTMRQMGSVNGGLLPPERAKELLAKINSPDLKPEELISLIHQHGGGSGMG